MGEKKGDVERVVTVPGSLGDVEVVVSVVWSWCREERERWVVCDQRKTRVMRGECRLSRRRGECELQALLVFFFWLF